MTRLEHLNLVVRDINASAKFYFTALPHWKVRDKGRSDWYGKERNWMHIGDDHQYLTLNDDGEDENRDLTGHQTGLAHFAFETSDINGLTERLTSAGYRPHSPGKHEFRQNIYFVDPAGFEVEFVQYFSDEPEKRNM